MKIENLLSLSLPNTDLSDTPIEVKGPPGVDTTSEIIKNIPQFLITVIFLFGIVLAIIFIILSGIQWILSSGDEKKIETARQRLTYSIIGLIVVIASAVIVSLVFGLLGIDAKPFSIQSFTQQGSGVSREESQRLREFELNCQTFPERCIEPTPASGSTDSPTDNCGITEKFMGEC